MFDSIFIPNSRRDPTGSLFRVFIGFNDRQLFINKIRDIRKTLQEDTRKNIFLINQSLDIHFDNTLSEDIKNILIKTNLNFSNEFKEYICKYFNYDNKKNIDSFVDIISLFLKKENTYNISIVSNFVLKMIHWSNIYCTNTSVPLISIYPPCMFFIGSIKKHELYFLLYLNLIGWDVIYINSDEKNPIAEYNMQDFKISLVHGKVFEKIDWIKELQNYQYEDMTTKKYDSLKEFIKYIKSFNKKTILREIFIGIDTALDDYLKEILELNYLLKNKYNEKYVLLEEVFSPTINELKAIEEKSGEVNGINELVKSVFPQIENSFNLIIEDFKQINNSPNIVENFALKLLVWSIRYKNLIVDGNSIVLFWGNIKKHELYFLELLNKENVSVIYINTDKEYIKLFKNDTKFNINELTESISNISFPIERVIKKQKTETYLVSKEIDKLLYEGNESLIRPYKLNKKQMETNMIVSTLEEYLILWNEPSQYRNGFSNSENIIQIPNIFIKINGTYNDIKRYWGLIKKIKNCDNSIFIDKTDFAKTTYTKQDFAKAAFLFSDYTLNCEKLINDERYINKFGHLSNDIQNSIIEKTVKVMQEGIFIEKPNLKLNIEVLLTILEIDERFLTLIERHSYGEKVPKLILYNNNKNRYSKKDCIIIMFLVLMGTDVCIFSPTNYKNIELVIDNNIFEILQLENLEYDLVLPDLDKIEKKSLLRRILER